MTLLQQNTASVEDKASSGNRKQAETPFCSDKSELWYDSDSNPGEGAGKDPEEGEGEGEGDGEGEGEDSENEVDEGGGDSDSTESAESSDSISTPESSPPKARHAIMHGKDDACTSAVGCFDAHGNWTWSQRRPKDDERIVEPGTFTSQSVHTFSAEGQPVLNRHDRAHIAMTGSTHERSGRTHPPVDWFWTQLERSAEDERRDSDEDSFDVVGYTSYHPRSAGTGVEGHSVVVPLRIRLEDDSSSDESESSVTTSSSCGSDPEARRRARNHMLQRLGRNVAIPQRRASALRLGHGLPRRPPSLDEISNRVVSGSAGSCSRGMPNQQRAVSCPSPHPLHREWFGEVQVMVTPPTPQMPAEKIPGVVLKSAHTPSCAFSTDARGNLVAPAFDVAPGRQIMLEERERQAKEWLQAFKAQQQEQQKVQIRLGAGTAAPPVATGEQAAAAFTPSSPTRHKTSTGALSSSDHDSVADGMRQDTSGPPIPPRRRSFGGHRRASGQVSVQPARDTIDSAQSQSHAPAPLPIQAPPRTRSPCNLPSKTSSNDATALDPTRRSRSLVARLSLRKSSKEIKPLHEALLITRKPVAAPF